MFFRLTENDKYVLKYDDIIKIGELDFLCCRYHVETISNVGIRACMEDAHQSIQNIFVKSFVPISYFAVFDGHAGHHCS